MNAKVPDPAGSPETDAPAPVATCTPRRDARWKKRRRDAPSPNRLARANSMAAAAPIPCAMAIGR